MKYLIIVPEFASLQTILSTWELDLRNFSMLEIGLLCPEDESFSCLKCTFFLPGLKLSLLSFFTKVSESCCPVLVTETERLILGKVKDPSDGGKRVSSSCVGSRPTGGAGGGGRQ